MNGRETWAGGGDHGGEGDFIPAPRSRGFGRLRINQLPGVPGGGRSGAGATGWAGGREGAGGRQGGSELPSQIMRTLKEKRNRKTVSLNFMKFTELPEINQVHSWLKEQGLLNREDQDNPGRKVDWMERNIYAKKYFMHMMEEEGAEWMQRKFGEEGRDWIDPETGEVAKITAKWEGGPMWKQVVIKGIDPNTPVGVVEEVFSKYGEMKSFQYEELDGIRWNQATVLLRIKEDTPVPVFVFTGSAESMERWEIVYRGRPRVCYGCYRPGHNKRQCQEQVTIAQLNVPGGLKGSYAQVLMRQERREEPEIPDNLRDTEVTETLEVTEHPKPADLKGSTAQDPAGLKESLLPNFMNEFGIASEHSSVDGDEELENEGKQDGKRKSPLSPEGGEEKKLKSDGVDKVPQLDGIIDEVENEQEHGVLTLKNVMKYPEKGVCEVCGKEGSRCRGCYLVHYCGSSCQKKDWKTHKIFCMDIKKQICGPGKKNGGGGAVGT